VLGDLRNAGLKFTTPLRANDPGGVTIASKTTAPPAPQPPAAAAKVDFGRDVQPIFRQHCISCHGPVVHQNGFRLDQRSAAFRGSTMNPGVIHRGESSSSYLVMRISGSGGGPQMPPTGALRAEDIATITAWIDQGADWPDALAGETPPAPSNPKATRLIDAIRAGNRALFKSLAAEPNVGGLRGPGGSTPLMNATLYGDLAMMRPLLDGGADPNARNDVGATALLWSVGDVEKTRLLLDRGAAVDLKSDDGRTALFIAAGQPGGSSVVKVLLERGASTAVKAPGLGVLSTPLLEAVSAGDIASTRLLLEHGADAKAVGAVGLAYTLHARCQECFDLVAGAMDKEALTIATFVESPPLGEATSIGPLLDRGADAMFKDTEGSTLLLRVASSDVLPMEVAKSVLARGVDVNAANKSGQTALSVARRHGHTALVDLLVKAGATDPAPTASPAPTSASAAAPAPSPRAAVERVLPLLQQTDVTFMKKSGCVSCHNNTLTAMTVAAARGRGIRVDEETARRQAEAMVTFLDGWRERALQGIGIPGDADTIGYILLGLAAEKQPGSDATESMARYLRRQQRPNGQWRIAAHRPPIESSDIQVTATALRSLQVYAPKQDRALFDKNIRAATAWLESTAPRTTEDRAFQLLGLGWARAGKPAIQRAAQALVSEQRADGGWAQLPSMSSDAYATGQALVALEESGALTISDPAYKRGVDYLLKTQLADGSWFVKTRALPIQQHFDSGFPHGKDQFISAAASNWAAIALARSLR
jgi:ankyrin repeat protein